MAKHGIFVKELCKYENDATLIRSAVRPDEVNIDNGTFVTLTKIADERELWTAAVGTADSTDIWVVNTPEVIYDESKKYGLADFYNGINDVDVTPGAVTKKTPMRVVKLVKYDEFGLTEPDFTVTSNKADTPDSTKKYLHVAAGGKWTANATESGAIAVFNGVSTDNASFPAVDGETVYSFIVL